MTAGLSNSIDVNKKGGLSYNPSFFTFGFYCEGNEELRMKNEELRCKLLDAVS